MYLLELLARRHREWYRGNNPGPTFRCEEDCGDKKAHYLHTGYQFRLYREMAGYKLWL